MPFDDFSLCVPNGLLGNEQHIFGTINMAILVNYKFFTGLEDEFRRTESHFEPGLETWSRPYHFFFFPILKSLWEISVVAKLAYYKPGM